MEFFDLKETDKRESQVKKSKFSTQTETFRILKDIYMVHSLLLTCPLPHCLQAGWMIRHGAYGLAIEHKPSNFYDTTCVYQKPEHIAKFLATHEGPLVSCELQAARDQHDLTLAARKAC